MYVDNGYSHGYEAMNVRRYAEGAARTISRLIREGTIDGVVVHGNSGVSIGFAALMIADFPLFLLRKPGDNSHGAPLEGPSDVSLGRYCILDDFVSSGTTVRRIVERIDELYKLKLSYGVEVAQPVPVCVLTYRHTSITALVRNLPNIGCDKE